MAANPSRLTMDSNRIAVPPGHLTPRSHSAIISDFQGQENSEAKEFRGRNTQFTPDQSAHMASGSRRIARMSCMLHFARATTHLALKSARVGPCAPQRQRRNLFNDSLHPSREGYWVWRAPSSRMVHIATITRRPLTSRWWTLSIGYTVVGIPSVLGNSMRVA